MPGQNVHQVSVCCWSTRGQLNNDELLWVTQKWPILKLLLPNLAGIAALCVRGLPFTGKD